jgi:hypothetical protein
MNTRSTRLHDFFHSMARQSFAELGLDDEAVVSYVTNVITEFARADSLYAASKESGRAVDSVTRILLKARDVPSGAPGIACTHAMRKYVGDYTLFMSGLFRTHVEKRGALGYYLEEGRRAYWAVSELELLHFRTGFLLFQQLSKNFEYYSGALDYMRQAYFASASGASLFKRFLKQIEGWISTGLSDN